MPFHQQIKLASNVMPEETTHFMNSVEAMDNSGDELNSEISIKNNMFDENNSKLMYLLEHLATFTVSKTSGIVLPEDGMRRLLELEKTSGIWSQKMLLCFDNQWVLIIDFETNNVIERFRAHLIKEPTAFISENGMELYNNIVVFVVADNDGTYLEMHIFQSQDISAVCLVEDLKKLVIGKDIQQRDWFQNAYNLQQSQQYNNLLKNNSHKFKLNCLNYYNKYKLAEDRELHLKYSPEWELLSNYAGIEPTIDTDSEFGNINDETSSTSSEKYERDVYVLNHCFDDIEKFVGRLQHAAAASRELNKKHQNLKLKKADPGEGLLVLKTRLPHELDFIDIFSKFKLSFNLLSKLRSHIHDPNAPELVHFLFTPLALIVEAASDAYYAAQLSARAITPLLTREAVNLLINCVTSKETELWRSLGDAWTIPRDQWKEVGSYHPTFFDGWSPEYIVMDEINKSKPSTNIKKYNTRSCIHNNSTEIMPHEFSSKINNKNEIIESIEKNKTLSLIRARTINAKQPKKGSFNSHAAAIPNFQLRKLSSTFNGNNENSISNGNNDPKKNIVEPNANEVEFKHCQLESWINDIKISGSKLVVVTYPRSANNDKELSVVRGEYLEIIDDTRKWWKARNIHGVIGHVPHTIVSIYNLNRIFS